MKNRAALLVMIFSGLTASQAIANDESVERDVARKDFEAAMKKIRADDSAAIEKCRSANGAAVEACLIQTRGKRLRAEQDAKTRLAQVGQQAQLDDSKAKAASEQALDAAKREKRSTESEIKAESKAAGAECKKLAGAERKTCKADVALRGNEADDLADATYKKARSNAKALKAP